MLCSFDNSFEIINYLMKYQELNLEYLTIIKYILYDVIKTINKKYKKQIDLLNILKDE